MGQASGRDSTRLMAGCSGDWRRHGMEYRKIYRLYQGTTGTPRERAEAVHEKIHGNQEYGRLADAPVEWLEHKIETGEINCWK